MHQNRFLLGLPLGEFTALAGTGGEGTGHSTCLPPRFDNPGYGPGVFNPSPRGGPNQWLNYSDRRAGSMKKIESQNEITIIGEYKYER